MDDQNVILAAIQSLQRDLTAIRGDISSVRSEMATKLESVRSEMATKQDLESVRSEMATKLEESHLELLTFMQEKMATKYDFENFKAEVMTHIDGLAAYNQKFDQELLMIRNRQDRLEERFAQ